MLGSNLYTIRCILSSANVTDCQAFYTFCQETLDLYMADAGWYQMPLTLHRVLEHGCAVIEATPLKLGLTSDEGSESTTKFATFLQRSHPKNSLQYTM
jgi:hypothetical protein